MEFYDVLSAIQLSHKESFEMLEDKSYTIPDLLDISNNAC
jgi:hypothetical protein